MISLINSLYFKGTAYSQNKKFLNSFISFITVCYRHFGLRILGLLECGKYHINAKFTIAVLFSYITKVEVCLSSPKCTFCRQGAGLVTSQLHENETWWQMLNYTSVTYNTEFGICDQNKARRDHRS